LLPIKPFQSLLIEINHLEGCPQTFPLFDFVNLDFGNYIDLSKFDFIDFAQPASFNNYQDSRQFPAFTGQYLYDATLADNINPCVLPDGFQMTATKNIGTLTAKAWKVVGNIPTGASLTLTLKKAGSQVYTYTISGASTGERVEFTSPVEFDEMIVANSGQINLTFSMLEL